MVCDILTPKNLRAIIWAAMLRDVQLVPFEFKVVSFHEIRLQIIYESKRKKSGYAQGQCGSLLYHVVAYIVCKAKKKANPYLDLPVVIVTGRGLIIVTVIVLVLVMVPTMSHSRLHRLLVVGKLIFMRRLGGVGVIALS